MYTRTLNLLNINTDELLKILETYTNMDSHSCCKEDVDGFSHIIERDCEAVGFDVIRHHQDMVGDFLELTVGKGQKKILLLGHMDTVYPAGTATKRPFRRDSSRIYGPGVLDMKGGILIILQAMKMITLNIHPEYRVTAFLNSDEETGSRYSEKYIKEHASSAVAVLSFEGAKPATLTTERKGVMAFGMEVTGIAAHSGVNYQLGSSAIEEAAHKILKLYTLRDNDRDITINVGTINGGIAGNIIAPCARTKGEIRYFTSNDRSSIIGRLSEIANEVDIPGTSTEIRTISDRPPLAADDGCKRLYKAARREAEILGRRLSPRKTGGGGDAAFAGIYGIPILDGLGLEGENSHTENEYALVDSLSFKIELAVRIILRIMEGTV